MCSKTLDTEGKRLTGHKCCNHSFVEWTDISKFHIRWVVSRNSTLIINICNCTREYMKILFKNFSQSFCNVRALTIFCTSSHNSAEKLNLPVTVSASCFWSLVITLIIGSLMHVVSVIKLQFFLYSDL